MSSYGAGSEAAAMARYLGSPYAARVAESKLASLHLSNIEPSMAPWVDIVKLKSVDQLIREGYEVSWKPWESDKHWPEKFTVLW